MDFKKLIDKNANADLREKIAVETAGGEVMKKVADFFHSLDKDMLVAIQKFGYADYKCGGTKFRRFVNSDESNALSISVSEDTHNNGNPNCVFVRIGANGFVCNYGGACIQLMDFAATMDRYYKTILVDPSVWVEYECRPDLANDVFCGNTLRFTSGRRTDDNRDWFERAYDALSHFILEFSKYLEERAGKINGKADAINSDIINK